MSSASNSVHSSLYLRFMIPRDTAAGKRFRIAKGLNMRDVFELSGEIGRVHHKRAFFFPPSRLSDIEARGLIPDLARLYVASLIYDCTVAKLMKLYGWTDTPIPACKSGTVNDEKSPTYASSEPL